MKKMVCIIVNKGNTIKWQEMPEWNPEYVNRYKEDHMGGNASEKCVRWDE